MNVEMKCKSCGGTKFSFDDKLKNPDYTCTRCGKVYTRDQLLQATRAKVEKQVGETFAKDLKKAFRGNKNITIK